MTQNSNELTIKPLVWSIAGPASVLLSLLLLVIKESPFYIDMTVVAMTGLFLAWRFKVRGAVASSVLLASVLAYDFWIERDPIGVWDFGLGASLALSFAITALASVETLERMKKASAQAIAEVQSWESKLEELIGAKKVVEGDLAIKRDQLLEVKRLSEARAEETAKFSRLLALAREELIAETAKREEVERQLKISRAEAASKVQVMRSEADALLPMAREELIEQTKRREEAEQNAFSYKIQLAKSEEELSDQNNQLKALQIAAEKQIDALHFKLAESESSIKSLAEQMEELANRLKDLQGEKEKLEQSLGEALSSGNDISDQPQGGRYVGLYKQLREQFDEKHQQLLEARAERFQLEQRLLEIEKAKTDENLYDESGALAQAAQEILELSAQVTAQQEEIHLLEQLVDQSIR